MYSVLVNLVNVMWCDHTSLAIMSASRPSGLATQNMNIRSAHGTFTWFPYGAVTISIGTKVSSLDSSCNTVSSAILMRTSTSNIAVIVLSRAFLQALYSSPRASLTGTRLD